MANTAARFGDKMASSFIRSAVFARCCLSRPYNYNLSLAQRYQHTVSIAVTLEWLAAVSAMPLKMD